MAEKQPEAPFPVTHALVVSNYSILLGLQCGIDSADEIHALGVGGLLHEIGKTIIDSEFYTRLDNKSFIPNARLKSYPKVGGELLKKMKVVPAPALRPVLEHQERLDGSGYPLSLQADGIGLMGRIVAICDAYHEALHPAGVGTGPTPYKVLRQMRRETTKFDGAILVKFIRMLGGQFCN